MGIIKEIQRTNIISPRSINISHIKQEKPRIYTHRESGAQDQNVNLGFTSEPFISGSDIPFKVLIAIYSHI